jgi:hypothetical protein
MWLNGLLYYSESFYGFSASGFTASGFTAAVSLPPFHCRRFTAAVSLLH